MSYASTVKQLNAQKEDGTFRRTDYRCKAHGCPNAGCMDRDLCFFHWRAGDVNEWSAIAHQIRTTWPEMANWGEEKTALEAKRATERRAARGPARGGNAAAFLLAKETA